ncbi:MAG: 2-succinyl-6-hydroxy-2,4-cyclohexadiene-1-carboxylate synthase [Phycisphaerae bacterium]|nr:2-succinyl-6-hydroxy-2,4-cyclohexadiene-1-carboxylate synthase [Phycisphaerae bacterium]
MHRTFVLTIGLLFCSTIPAWAEDNTGVDYVTEDGVTIVGDFYKPKDLTQPAPVLILLHMYHSDRTAWQPLLPALYEAGFAVLAIDMRGHGESIQPEDRQLRQKMEERDVELFQNMWKDVAGAYQWLTQRPEVDLSRFGLVGASVGCSVALDYAGRDKSVDVLVLMTPGKNYLGLDSLQAAQKYGPRPLLMLSTEEERGVGLDPLAALIEQDTTRVFSQSEAHGTQMFGKVPHVEQELTDYLRANIGSLGTAPVVASINSDVYHLPGSSAVQQIKRENLRIFSSATEAQQRGLRPAKK